MPLYDPGVLARGDAAAKAVNSHPFVMFTYCVSDKRPPSYERKWYLRVVTEGRAVKNYERPDDAQGSAPLYEQALRDLTASGAFRPVDSDDPGQIEDPNE